MDKLREEFAERNEMSMDFVNWFFDDKKEGCGGVWFMMAAAMWEGWKGGRESIVVELPEQRDEDFDTDVSYNEGLHDAAKSLRSIGLSIKGE